MVVLQLTDLDGKVEPKDKDPLKIPLKPATQARIEKKLADILASAFMNSIFATDLGFRIPITAPPYEKVQSQVRLQGALSDVLIKQNGLELVFDSRLQAWKNADCVSLDAFKKASLLLERPSSIPQEKEEDADLAKAANWNLSMAPGSNWKVNKSTASFHKVTISLDGLQQIAIGGYGAGRFCPSTRAIWPRKGYVPLVEFQPEEPPFVKLGSGELDLEIQGAFQTYQRNGSFLKESFEKIKEPVAPLNLKLGFSVENSDQVDIDLPKEIKLNTFSEKENDLVAKLLNILALGPKAKFPVNTHLQFSIPSLIQPFVSPLKFGSVQLSDRGLQVSYDPMDYSWMHSVEKTEATPSNSDEILTTFVSTPGESISTPFAAFTWKQGSSSENNKAGVANAENNDPLFYSWRLVRDGAAVTANAFDWSPFEDVLQTTVPVPEPGRYVFQLKGMNRAYMIEEVPLTYQFRFAGDPNQPAPIAGGGGQSLTGPEGDGAAAGDSSTTGSSSASSTKAPTPAPKATDKSQPGLFGCSLSVENKSQRSQESDYENSSILLLLAAASGLMLSCRRGFSRKARRS